MLTETGRRTIGDLAAAMLVTRQMATACGTPVQVASGARVADALPVANVVGKCLGYPELRTGAWAADLPVHAVIDEQLALAGAAEELARVPPSAWPEVEALAIRACAGDYSTFCRQILVTSGDGVPVLAYVAGPPTAPPVLLSAPCGMPARLVEPWMRHLAHRARAVTWESRGMFGGVGAFDAATSVEAQVGDAVAVLQALNLDGVHVAGLCGGAVVAAELAATAPARVASVSLWHGDFHLGALAPKTDHQQDLLALMTMAARSPSEAASIHGIICQSMADNVPADLAAQLLYPYVTPALFQRYCQLNGAIMQHDITATLPGIKHPALVVTSRTDATAHPDGSLEVARRLPDATLVMRDSGDHISLFRGEPELLTLIDGWAYGLRR
ncbi:MAG TPA: alpha/beta hydrolase [Streptosporangiaceae bacterium]|nr:alpha/beta hydrolase [Streptosporangiaceae bacterium]